MQTFLPYPNFVASAMCLDRLRLGKQRVECRQMQTAIQAEGGGWWSHPCTQMWKDHILALMLYGDCVIREWERRGYENNMPTLVIAEHSTLLQEVVMPPWLGDDKVHASHRAALLHKDPEHYGQFGWTEEPALDYVWPKSEDYS